MEEELENVEEIILTVEDETVAESTRDNWQHYQLISMKKPLNEILKNVINGGTSEHIQTPPSKRKRTSPNEDNGWSTRRRPTAGVNITLAHKFEELTEIKAKATKLQLAILKEENMHQNMKWECQREEYSLKQTQLKELHELQKTSLQLDIEIKKKQLEKLNMLV
ncbi:uncharacterized protein LOC108904350 [Anoplophora glabripennis]|uniref:uncharacterized protein LOC108904350 n=1 Tax=Anoplophora glabripennis TaxID=217634 RepID=UPI0008746162|nr:uncharacterized protein LOC108904350 [Anoplophora glabripennis]